MGLKSFILGALLGIFSTVGIIILCVIAALFLASKGAS